MFKEFQNLREQGVKITARWFQFKAETLFRELYPEKDPKEFKISSGWFIGFKRRNQISLRSITNKGQAVPGDHLDQIRSFHWFIRRNARRGVQVGPLGQFRLSTIANMDQTPLEFDFNAKGKTYDNTGAKTVWAKSTGSGMEKRQCTVQHTIYADGVFRTKTVIIFRGTGKRVSQGEKKQWDPRVYVTWQEKAWADESVTLEWARFVYRGFEREPRLLVMDAHRAQKTESVRNYLRNECNTIIALVPPGNSFTQINFICICNIRHPKLIVIYFRLYLVSATSGCRFQCGIQEGSRCAV